MPIWLLTLIHSWGEAALSAVLWVEKWRKAHSGRPLSLLELLGTTEGHTLIYEYADRHLHTSLRTWLLPYAKEPPGSPYFRQHDILTFTLPTVLLSLGSEWLLTAERIKTKENWTICLWERSFQCFFRKKYASYLENHHQRNFYS